MTPAAYFDELVVPTLDEFEADPTSIRRAYAACLFAWHFADAVHVDRRETKGSVRKGIAAHANPDRAYWTVADVANLVKHLELDRPELPFTLKLKDTHVGSAAPFKGNRYFKENRSWVKAPKVVCTRDDQGIRIDLRWAMRETRRAIEAYLTSRPELGQPQTGT